MVINKISQNSNLFVSERNILNLGPSLKISYCFLPTRDLPESLHILYEIRLVENNRELIGIINAEYEFILNPIFYATENGFSENEESIVKDCLKRNHYNIRDLVEDVLKENQLNINANYTKSMN